MKRIITFIALLTLLATGLQAQIIDATNNTPKKKEKTLSNTPIYKPTGHYLRFEAGYPHFASVAYGYQTNPYIMIGGGVGFGIICYTWTGTRTIYNSFYNEPFIMKHSGTGFPIYAEVNLSTPKYKWSLIANIKFGYAIPLEEGHRVVSTSGYYIEWIQKGRRLWGALNLGVTYRNFSLCAGISSNNDEWYSFFISYNLPLKVH